MQSKKELSFAQPDRLKKHSQITDHIILLSLLRGGAANKRDWESNVKTMRENKEIYEQNHLIWRRYGNTEILRLQLTILSLWPL